MTEHYFDLAHSAPATLSSLIERLAYLSDSNFVDLFVKGDLPVPDDVYEKTKLIVGEIAHLGMGLESFNGDLVLMNEGKVSEILETGNGKDIILN